MFKSKIKNKSGIFTTELFNKNTHTIKKFYKDSPFPNYKNQENKASLVDTGNNNNFMKNLKQAIGYNKKILEVGSGTCQLSNYLAIGTNNHCYALDPTWESLMLGKKFASDNEIKNVSFVNGDLFDDIFEESSFDIVICLGVLHHTKNPKLGFENILRYLKKDGYVIIGLYNQIGRLRTNFRQLIYKNINKNLALFMDPIVRKMNKNDNEKRKSWIRDQYEHPIESSHTIDEVLNWFDKKGVNFINVFPNDLLSKNNNKIFDKIQKNDKFERIMQQISMLFNTSGSEGGLFIMIGKK